MRARCERAEETRQPRERGEDYLAASRSGSGRARSGMCSVHHVRYAKACQSDRCPVKVQGESAAEDISEAIRRLNRLHASRVVSIDVLIVGRDNPWSALYDPTRKHRLDSLRRFRRSAN